MLGYDTPLTALDEGLGALAPRCGWVALTGQSTSAMRTVAPPVA
jgi:hypothetical protein